MPSATAALDAIRRSIEDMREEIQAQTKAIPRVLDRLDGGEQAA